MTTLILKLSDVNKSFGPIDVLHNISPDRVPIYFTITPQVAEKLSQHLAIPEYTHPDSPHAENRISYTELLLELGNDVVGIGPCAPKAHPTTKLEDGTLITELWISPPLKTLLVPKLHYLGELIPSRSYHSGRWMMSKRRCSG